jgi:hypothetical protein
MDNRRGVVTGIPPSQGIADRCPEESVPVRLPDAFVNCFSKITAGDMDVLPDVNEQNRQPGILAEGHGRFPGDHGVFFYFFKTESGDFRGLPGQSVVKTGRDIVVQLRIGMEKEPPYRFRDSLTGNVPHRAH